MTLLKLLDRCYANRDIKVSIQYDYCNDSMMVDLKNEHTGRQCTHSIDMEEIRECPHASIVIDSHVDEVFELMLGFPSEVIVEKKVGPTVLIVGGGRNITMNDIRKRRI